MKLDPLLPPAPVRAAIAARSLVGPATLIRYFRGQAVQPASRTRIESAMRELGLDQYLRGPEAPKIASPQLATGAPGPVPGKGEG